MNEDKPNKNSSDANQQKSAGRYPFWLVYSALAIPLFWAGFTSEHGDGFIVLAVVCMPAIAFFVWSWFDEGGTFFGGLFLSGSYFAAILALGLLVVGFGFLIAVVCQFLGIK